MSILKRFGWFILGLSLLGSAIVVGMPQTASANQPILAQGNVNGVRYLTYQDNDGSIVTELSFQHRTRDELLRHVEENHRMASQLQSEGVAEVTAEVTLRHPVPLSDFPGWTQSRPLRVSSYTVRLVDKNGQRVTVGGAPGNGGLVASDSIQRILNHLSERGVMDLRGVITVEGTLKTKDYEQLAGDPDVFLVDISGTYIRDEILNRNPALRDRPQRIVVPPAFWYLEDLGLTGQ